MTYQEYLQAQAATGNEDANILLGTVGNDGNLNATLAGDGLVHSGTALDGSGFEITWNGLVDRNDYLREQYLNDGGSFDTGNLLGTSNTGETGGTGGTDYSSQIAGYNDEIAGYQNALQLLQPTYNANVTNLENTRTNRRNQLVNDFALATRDYNTQRGDTLEDRRVAAQGSIDGNRARLQALQRLLGSQGAGNSSAALVTAPHLSQQRGVQDLSGIQRTYGRNLRSLDTAFDDTERDRDKTYSDIDTAFNIGRRGYEADRLEKQANLLDQIRTASINRDNLTGVAGPYTAERNAIQSLLQQVIGLRQNPAVPSIGNVRYNAPSLGSYNLQAGRGLASLLGPNAAPLPPANSPIYNPQEDEEA